MFYIFSMPSLFSKLTACSPIWDCGIPQLHSPGSLCSCQGGWVAIKALGHYDDDYDDDDDHDDDVDNDDGARSPSILVVKKSEGLVGLQHPSVSCSVPEFTYQK